MPDLLRLTEAGLYCEAGDFFVDPWMPVERAVITHAHSDHARWGMSSYLCAEDGQGVLRMRVGDVPSISGLAYGQAVTIGSAKVSLHPAGHILGSAQVRIEVDGEAWVVSGDYKVQPDPTCAPFELVPCHTFVTESTFGLPIYSWPEQAKVFADIGRWWATNREQGKASVLFGYSLGKSQRILAGVDSAIGPILCHGAVIACNESYRAAGVSLPDAGYAARQPRGYPFREALILAPPSAQASPWLRRFGEISTAFASGWMAIRGIRRRRAVDRGFVLSDHVDWASLIQTVKATGAERVWVTHGYSNIVARYLQELGIEAHSVPTRFEGEVVTGGLEAEAEASEEVSSGSSPA